MNMSELPIAIESETDIVNPGLYYWCAVLGPKGKLKIHEPMMIRVREDGMAEYVGWIALDGSPFIAAAPSITRLGSSAGAARVKATRLLDPQSLARYEAGLASKH